MNKYIWANISAAIVLIGLTTGVFLLKGEKHKNARRLVLLIICTLLIVYKTIEYAYYQVVGMRYKIPMEFSQVAYFIFPLSVFLSKKTKALMPVSAFCAIIAGFFYDLSWIVSAKTFFERDTIYQMLSSMLWHNILYFGGMLVLTNEKLPLKQSWQLPIGVAGIVGWHYLMHALVDNDRDIILKTICEGSILDSVMPSVANKPIIIGLYYTALMITLFGSFIAFYAANNAFTRKRPQDLT